MKQFFAALLLFVILAFVSFFYRNTVEHRAASTVPGVTACTMEAKLCPDGTAVGRIGTNCNFAQCAAPNVELPTLGISFVLPAGFVENPSAIVAGDTLIAAYEKESTTTPKSAVIVRRFAIPEGKSADEVILANTTYEASGDQAKSMSEFKEVSIKEKTFQTVTVERFEAHVHTLYYLVREKDVLRFEALDVNVFNWTDPALVISALPAHKTLIELLGTLQSN